MMDGWPDISLAHVALLAGGIALLMEVLNSSMDRLVRWRTLLRIPSPPMPSLLFGHTSVLVSDKAPLILAEYANKFGALVRLRLPHASCVILSDLAEASRLLRRGPDYLPKSRKLYEALELGIQPKTPNLVTANDGPMWKLVRTAIAPAFSATSLQKVRSHEAWPCLPVVCGCAHWSDAGGMRYPPRATAQAAMQPRMCTAPDASQPFLAQAMPRVQHLTRRACEIIELAGPGGEVDVVDLAKKITCDVMVCGGEGGCLLSMSGPRGRPAAVHCNAVIVGCIPDVQLHSSAASLSPPAHSGPFGRAPCCLARTFRASRASEWTGVVGAERLGPRLAAPATTGPCACCALTPPAAPPPPPPARTSDYMALFNDLVQATHARFNPLRRLQALWDKQAAAEERYLKMHDTLMTDKLEALKKNPPADWTIAGG